MKLKEMKKGQNNGVKKHPLFRLENKLNYKSLTVFSVVGMALLVLSVLMYNLTKNLISETDLANAPDFIKELLSVNTFSDYFASNVAQTWILVSAIFAAMLGYRIIAGNFKDGSFRLLYTQNMSRKYIVLVKYAVFSIYTAAINVVLYLSVLISTAAAGFEVSFLNMFVFFIAATLVSHMVGSIVFSFTLVSAKKMNSAYSIVFVVVLLFVALFALVVDQTVLVSYLSPLTVVLQFDMVAGLSKYLVIVYLSWFVVEKLLWVLSYKKFVKKDLI